MKSHYNKEHNISTDNIRHQEESANKHSKSTNYGEKDDGTYDAEKEYDELDNGHQEFAGVDNDNDNIKSQTTREELEKKILQLEDALLRMKADNENLRRRHIKEIDDTQKYAISSFVRDMIDVIESLYNTQAHVIKEDDAQKKVDSLVHGIELIIKSLEKIYEKYCITRIMPAKGEQFDHNLQQAISSIETGDQKNDTLYDVIRAGYMINERLLRPALVVVAKNNTKK